MLTPFWEGKTMKHRLKNVFENVFVLTLIFDRFFTIFSHFGSILGGPRASKNGPKIKKIDLGRQWEALWTY